MFFMHVGSKSLTTGENVNINYELHYKHNFKCKYVVYIHSPATLLGTPVQLLVNT